MTTLVKSQAAGSGSATSSQSVTIPVQMQNVQGIKTLRTSQNQGQPSMVHLRHQLVQGGPRSKIIPQGGQTILATSQQGQKVALSQVAAGTKGKPKIFETIFYTKAELVQVNHTPIICLRNFINKKVGNRKN